MINFVKINISLSDSYDDDDYFNDDKRNDELNFLAKDNHSDPEHEDEPSVCCVKLTKLTN